MSKTNCALQDAPQIRFAPAGAEIIFRLTGPFTSGYLIMLLTRLKGIFKLFLECLLHNAFVVLCGFDELKTAPCKFWKEKAA